MEAIHTEDHGNIRIEIHYDDDPSSPRDRQGRVGDEYDHRLDPAWDNLTTIRGWHRRMTIGDGPDIRSEDHESFTDMIQTLMDDELSNGSPIIFLAPLLWYEHSGMSCTMGTPIPLDAEQDARIDTDDLARFRSLCLDDAGWDSGVAGLVYVTAKSQANYGTPDELLEQAARQEVEAYDDYLRGNVYGFVVSSVTVCEHGDEHTDTLESCWGFFGDPTDTDYSALSEARAVVGWSISHALAGMIR